MTEIGGVFTKTVSLSASSFTTVSAATGEQVKITMAYGKRPGNGGEKNSNVYISPANGAENDANRGTTTGRSVPPVGANYNGGTANNSSLQPIFITDSDPLYVGSTHANPLDVLIQGVRVA